MNDKKMSLSFIVALGFMLFALFFGAGNLIFPPMLGQSAGTNIWAANAGFIVTGVGLPLLGVLALGFSGKGDLQSLASRVHPIYGVIFTVALYLSIGPLFAIPRTATVSYEIGIRPFLPEGSGTIALLGFSLVFFAITILFSLKASKIVDIVGKVLTPALLVFIGILIVTALLNPIGELQVPAENYANDAFFKGFQEGYLTMDALAAFVFGIIIINFIKERGAATKKQIMVGTAKAAIIAAILLAIIYASLGYIGAKSVSGIGSLENGGAILAAVSNHYFGSFGGVLLTLIVFGACLTTSIGLVTSCASYFNKLMPKVSYNAFVYIVSICSLVFANFGLTQLISISVPVLVAIYPLAICLMFLTFLHPLFKGRKEVYQVSILFTGIVAIFDGFNAAGISFTAVNDLFTSLLPLYTVGLGWVVPAIVGAVLGYVLSLVKRGSEEAAAMERVS